MNLTLYRAHLPHGDFGELYHDDERLCFTTERPWNHNRKFTSSIPEGVYTIVRHESPKFGQCWKVLNVPSRTDILIHAANTPDELEGCIAPSLGRGIINGVYAGTNSRRAMAKLYDYLGDGSHSLHIKYGLPPV